MVKAQGKKLKYLKLSNRSLLPVSAFASNAC